MVCPEIVGIVSLDNRLLDIGLLAQILVMDLFHWVLGEHHQFPYFRIDEPQIFGFS
jgi:hypothetical protein